jgi:hypothetical protein
VRAPAAEPPPPPTPPPFISKRDEILARYRENRNQPDEQQDDISDFAREGLPPDFVAQEPQPEPEPEIVSDQDAPPTPQRVKLKVFGEEKEMSLDEVIAKAQIALAADDVLDKAKSRLKEVDDLVAQTKDRVARTDPAGRPAGHDAQPSPSPQAQPAVDPNAPDPADVDIDQLVEAMQYGDPADARTKLRNTIDSRVGVAVEAQVNRALQISRLQDEGARTAKVLADFKAKHADIAADPLADAAIQTRMYQIQVEDLRAIGVDPAQIQTPTGQVTPSDIAQAHRFYRANGFNVMKPEEMLNKALDDFQAWRGVKPATPQPAADPAAPKATPRVEVVVNREARRAAIPQQPDRAASPRTPVQNQAPQVRDRSAIVRDEIARRNKPRGRVIGA